MKKILCIALLIGSFFIANAFSETKSDFEKELSEMDLKQKIPDDFIIDYLKLTPNKYLNRYISKISRFPNYYLINTSAHHPVGSIEKLYTFNKNGGIISQLCLSETSDSDGGPHSWTEHELLNENIFLIKRLSVDSGYFPTSLNEYKVELYKLNPQGNIIKIKNYSKYDKRIYLEVSKYKLDIKAIEKIDRKKLRLMRNEIFAHYGYIFESKDLNRYFSNFKWYKPRFKDVSEQLNPIEKYNVNIICQYELKNLK